MAEDKPEVRFLESECYRVIEALDGMEWSG